MTVTEAARLIGCSPQQVRTLVRSGRLPAKQVIHKSKASPDVSTHTWEINVADARRYRDLPTKGWPRGLSRLSTATQNKETK